MREFHEGPFSAERLRKWAADHAGRVACDGSKCEADAAVFNWPLHVLRLAPETMFAGVISTNHGDLTQTGLHLYDPGAGTMLFVDFAYYGTFESKRGTHGVYVGQEPIGKRLTMVYSVDLNADTHTPRH